MLFAQCFVNAYDEIYNHVDETREEDTISSLSVQLFTSPSISLLLIEKANSLEIILDELKRIIVFNKGTWIDIF